MKRFLPLVVLLAACTPDIPEEGTSRQNVITAVFDPAASDVPVPNDLAKDPTTGKIVVPARPTDTAAQKEFNEKYLGALDGFPFESTAKVKFDGDLDPASVNPQTVIGIDVTAQPNPIALAPALVGRAIAVAPPSGGWQRAHRYAIAVVAGPNGVRGKNGEAVVGSSAWALVTSPTSLVTCTDLAAPDCKPAVDVIPSSQHDPAAQLAEQTKNAIALERVRRGYAPIFDALAAKGITRENVPALWTFSIVDAGEMTFDPAGGVVPFPNEILRANNKVNLPNPKTGKPLTADDCKTPTDPQIQLTCGLNTLDGFSTLSPPISESSDVKGAVDQGTLDASTVNGKSVGLVPVLPQAPEPERTQPKISPCLNCVGTTKAPQQLQWKLDAPLDEKTLYLGYVTAALKDDKGKQVVPTPAFALLRSSAPLVENDRSAVDVLSDDDAKRLEVIRSAMKPAFDALGLKGLTRESLVLAFAFTTQSEATINDQLYGLPAKVPGLPAAPVFVADATAQYTAVATAGGIPIDAIGKFFVGEMITPVVVTGPGGTLDPTQPKPQPVSFVVSVPSAAPPPGGYPVTIFGHGFTRSRNDVIAIANALAKAGHVAIASDVIFHGERTSCTGSKVATKQPVDDAACANPVTQKCNEDPIAGRCVAKNDADRAACTPGPAGDATCRAGGQGRCVAADSKCEGGDFARDPSGKPLISGWNIFSLTNFFATRDNFRQQVVDLAQLVRIIKSGPSAIGAQVDATKIHYVGQSLGGILGALFNASSPETSHVALNVAGGALPQIILTAPSFAAQKEALIGGLAAQGIMPGTPGFDRFLGVVQWILDPVDPANVGYRLTHPLAAMPDRKVFLQFIEGDQTVPNVTNLALVAAANREFALTPPSFNCKDPLFCYEFTEQGDGFDASSAAPQSRHGFLLSPPQGAQGPALTVKAQGQVATFLATGRLP